MKACVCNYCNNSFQRKEWEIARTKMRNAGTFCSIQCAANNRRVNLQHKQQLKKKLNKTYKSVHKQRLKQHDKLYRSVVYCGGFQESHILMIELKYILKEKLNARP